MNEEQIQTLLAFALGEGGLGRGAGGVPGHDGLRRVDRGLHGQRRRSRQDRLGLRPRARARRGARSPRPQDAGRSSRDHLVDIDQGGSVKTDVYAPERYRAYLLEGQPGAPDQKAWPWPDVKTADFVSNGDPNAFQMPARVMTAGRDRGARHRALRGWLHRPAPRRPRRRQVLLALRPPAPPRRRELGGAAPDHRCVRWAGRRSLTQRVRSPCSPPA